MMVDLVPISTSAQPETITVHRLAPLAQILLGLTLVPVMRVGTVSFHVFVFQKTPNVVAPK